jgi:hypothetical protein
VAKKIAREVPLELVGQVFPTHLIVLDGQRIDVISGMSWMKLYKVVLDKVQWLVCLHSPVYGKHTLHLPVVVHGKASVHHIVAKSVEKM